MGCEVWFACTMLDGTNELMKPRLRPANHLQHRPFRSSTKGASNGCSPARWPAATKRMTCRRRGLGLGGIWAGSAGPDPPFSRYACGAQSAPHAYPSEERRVGQRRRWRRSRTTLVLYVASKLDERVKFSRCYRRLLVCTCNVGAGLGRKQGLRMHMRTRFLTSIEKCRCDCVDALWRVKSLAEGERWDSDPGKSKPIVPE